MNIDFNKSGGLVPAIIQHYLTGQVLMLGYMNAESYNRTCEEGLVTFYSRSRMELWTKGAVSGNTMQVKEIMQDCDRDTLLIQVMPAGPACHTGSLSCFNEITAKGFLYELANTIATRIDNDHPNSYTNRLFREGINRVIQKVGEEAVELVIAAKDSEELHVKNEAADLLYHLLILLKAKNVRLEDIELMLQQRSRSH